MSELTTLSLYIENPDNPQTVTDQAFADLVKSLKDCPETLARVEDRLCDRLRLADQRKGLHRQACRHGRKQAAACAQEDPRRPRPGSGGVVFRHDDTRHRCASQVAGPLEHSNGRVGQRASREALHDRRAEGPHVAEMLDELLGSAEAEPESGNTDEYADIWNADGKHVIDPRRLEVSIHVGRQSPDIARGVNRDGWGDQCIFFGLACRETPVLMPKDHTAAKRLGERLFDYALQHKERFGIDIKMQVTVDDFWNITDVVVAIPCRCGVDGVQEIDAIVRTLFCVDLPDVIINGTGAYVTHSSVGDCGTTGRKLVVDFYGSGSRIGGGSPWTKDPSKADLALNLFARHIAIAELDKRPNARRVSVALSCCIGQPEIECVVTACGETQSWTFDCYGPKRIAEKFHLRMQRYADACRYGLFTEFEELGE